MWEGGGRVSTIGEVIVSVSATLDRLQGAQTRAVEAGRAVDEAQDFAAGVGAFAVVDGLAAVRARVDDLRHALLATIGTAEDACTVSRD